MSGISCAIVGLPNVGKSTLFNALTKALIASENYPFCTIEPNTGVVNVVDKRLDRLSEISKSQKVIYPYVSFVDVAGLVEGASKGEGLGNQFLSHIRETDAIVQVVRCFENDDIVHVSGKVDPIADIEVINLELTLADLQMAENLLSKAEKQARAKKDKGDLVPCLLKVKSHLDQNLPLRTLELTDEEQELIKHYPFLTQKKILYVANVSEDDLPEMNNKYVQMVREYAEKDGASVIPICAAMEAEIAQLEEAEAVEFLSDLGLKETGLQRLIKGSYSMLDLITFITTGEIETRGWTIKKGMSAQESAGKIHTDIQKGFIRAEVIAYDDFKDGGRVLAKEEGKARAEGKQYIVQDGDIILFFHN